MLSKEKIASLKEKLIKEKERLEKELKDESGNLSESQSESSGENSYETHFADSGTTTFERERDLSLEQNIIDILKQVNHALEGIKKGKYGVCTKCSDEIDPARLKAIPYADLCINCKKKEEETW